MTNGAAIQVDDPVLAGLYLDLVNALGEGGQPPAPATVETCAAYVLTVAALDHGIILEAGDALLLGNMDVGVRGLKIFSVPVADNPLRATIREDRGGLVLTEAGLTLMGQLAEELPATLRNLAAATVSMVVQDGVEGIRGRILDKLGKPRQSVGWCSLSELSSAHRASA